MKIPFVDLKREANFLLDEIKNETEEVIKSGIYINGEKVKNLKSHLLIIVGSNMQLVLETDLTD